MSYRTSADSTDSRFTSIEKTLNEIINVVQKHQINATYDPNNPKTKQDVTRIGPYCKKFGHTIKFCWSLKKKKLDEEKTPPQPKETFSQNYPKQQKAPNKFQSNSNDRSSSQRGRSDSPYVSNRNRSRSNSYFGTVRFGARPDKLNLLYDTLQSCSP